MYYIGLDVHKKTISFCVKDAAGQVHSAGKIGSTRRDLDVWIMTLPEPRMMAMEATIFTGWIYDHLRGLPSNFVDLLARLIEPVGSFRYPVRSLVRFDLRIYRC